MGNQLPLRVCFITTSALLNPLGLLNSLSLLKPLGLLKLFAIIHKLIT